MTFPINVPAVTVWEKDISARAPTWIRHELGEGCWQDTRGQTDGRESDDHVFVALHESSVTYLPKIDDRILAGSVEQSSPPQGALTVAQVKDFRTLGSADMRHIEVILK